ncbi:MAG: AraC family transcriptional regulator [Opitutaceae bacterium]|nr:AraC family transcriptional regulator [Opitutaceae bacterium]
MAESDIFPHVRVAAEEVQRSADYHFENALREAPATFVIQRTIAGAAFFADTTGRRLVQPGQTMLFTHAEPSTYGYPPEATEPYRLQFISFAPGDLKPLFARLRGDFGAVVRMPDHSEAAGLFDETMQRYRQRKFRDRLEEGELLHRLLIALYRGQVQATQSTDPIEFGHHYVRNHFRSPINLKGVAQKCGISREHFIRQFTVRYGESPGAMLRRLRLEHARAMLLATRLNVQDVAIASGFTSSNTFGRAYRGRFGRSPGTQR